MKKLLITGITIVLFSGISFGQSQSEYASNLKRMFEVSGTEDTYKVAIRQMIELYKEQYTEVDKETWKDFEKEFMTVTIEDLTNMLVPVYEKYLTISDLQELISFYESPVGKKFSSSTPMIMQESMEVGAELGAKIGERFSKKMKEKGY